MNLSLDERAEAKLLAEGALPPLVAILRSGSLVLQEQASAPRHATRAPTRHAAHARARASTREHARARARARTRSRGPPRARAAPRRAAQAAWALANVTSSREAKMKAIELGALPTLKSLYRSSSSQMRQASTKIMTSLLSMVTPTSRKVFLPSQSTIRDTHRGRSPLVDGSRMSSAPKRPSALGAPSNLGKGSGGGGGGSSASGASGASEEQGTT